MSHQTCRQSLSTLDQSKKNEADCCDTSHSSQRCFYLDKLDLGRGRQNNRDNLPTLQFDQATSKQAIDAVFWEAIQQSFKGIKSQAAMAIVVVTSSANPYIYY